jgi:hypothetical protein
MTTTELCAFTGLTSRELQNWLDNGLLEPADMVGRPAGGGLRREFTRTRPSGPACSKHYTPKAHP